MIGSYGKEIIFYTSSVSALTFKNWSEQHGAKFAEHALIEGKPRKQYIGATNSSITFDIELRANIISGIIGAVIGKDPSYLTPRLMLEKLKKLAQEGEAHYLIIGGVPVSQHPFILTGISDKFNVVYNFGQLYSCSVSLTMEEYVESLGKSRI